MHRAAKSSAEEKPAPVFLQLTPPFVMIVAVEETLAAKRANLSGMAARR
jgi:hypothetical protein